MLLCTDVGNTNIKFALYERDKQIVKLRFATDPSKTEDEFAVELYTIFQINRIDIAKIEGSVISSVVPKVTNSLVQAIKKVTYQDTLVLSSGVKTGLDIRIENPATLGSDLVAMCVAVKKMYSCPAVVISLGTATTIVYMNSQRCYCGGSISPGVSISLDALTSNGALLPSIDLKQPKQIISTNTVECIRSGVILGTASMIDGMIDKYSKATETHPTLIATGGHATTIIPNCNHKIIINDDLVLEGIKIIYEKNK